jgi:hypothetical protein
MMGIQRRQMGMLDVVAADPTPVTSRGIVARRIG